MDNPVLHSRYMSPSSDYNSRVRRHKGLFDAGRTHTVSHAPYNRSEPKTQVRSGSDPGRAPASPGRCNELTRVASGGDYRSGMWRHPYTHTYQTEPDADSSLYPTGVQPQGGFVVPTWDGIPRPQQPEPLEGAWITPLDEAAHARLEEDPSSQGLELVADAMMAIHHSKHYMDAQQRALCEYDRDYHPTSGTPRTETYASPRYPVSTSHNVVVSDGFAGKSWGRPKPSHPTGGGGWRVAMREGLSPSRSCDLATPGVASPERVTAYRQGMQATPEYHLKRSVLAK